MGDTNYKPALSPPKVYIMCWTLGPRTWRSNFSWNFIHFPVFTRSSHDISSRMVRPLLYHHYLVKASWTVWTGCSFGYPMNALLYYLTGDELFSKKRSLLAIQAVRLVYFCMKFRFYKGHYVAGFAGSVKISIHQACTNQSFRVGTKC